MQYEPHELPYARPHSRMGLDPRFVYIVGVLLLVILAALTGLVLSYHRRATLAETQLHAVQSLLMRQNLGGLTFVPAIERDELRRGTARIDGQPTSVLELDADLGQMLGLAPGDWVHVAARDAAPTTHPGEPPAGPDSTGP